MANVPKKERIKRVLRAITKKGFFFQVRIAMRNGTAMTHRRNISSVMGRVLSRYLTSADMVARQAEAHSMRMMAMDWLSQPAVSGVGVNAPRRCMVRATELMTAVSALKISGPRETVWNPRFSASSTSVGWKPPSGPIRRHALRVAAGSVLGKAVLFSCS